MFPAVNELFMDVSRQWFLYFPHIGKVEQTHTRKGRSDKSLFLHKAPSVKSTSPHTLYYFIKKMLLKNISSVIVLVIFTYNSVFCYSISVSVGSQ
jgi:hypothetical protein